MTRTSSPGYRIGPVYILRDFCIFLHGLDRHHCEGGGPAQPLTTAAEEELFKYDLDHDLSDL